jgi:hypothetical protein
MVTAVDVHIPLDRDVFELEQTIARGDTGCRVVVHLTPPVEPVEGDGREYFGDPGVGAGATPVPR